MKYFTAKEIASGIFHIGEPSGIHCTLIVGSERALLFDTGYGFCDISQFVHTLTDLPLTVVNSHCHLDHAGGNHFFDHVYAHPVEQEAYQLPPDEKRSLLNRVEELYLAGKTPYPWPEGFDIDSYCTFTHCNFLSLTNHQIFDLGDRIAEAIYLPGHTKGCVLLYDHQSGILLSGDNISNSLWIMFEQSASLEEYESTLLGISQTYSISGILASHYGDLYPASLINEVVDCIDNRNDGTSTLFVHPRRKYNALKRKKFVEGIGYIYLVYPMDASS